MFNPNDWILVVQYLGLSMEDAPQVQSAMSDLATNHPDVVPVVQSLLSQLTELETSISSELSSPNYALTKADVLEWSEGGQRATGMFAQARRLIDQIYRLLNLEAYGLSLPDNQIQTGSSSTSIEFNHGW